MGWLNKIFKGSNQRPPVGNEHYHHNGGYYENYPHEHSEPSAETDADHTQEPSTSEVTIC